MKPSLLAVATVATTLASVSFVFYASQAISQSKPAAATPVYVPIGSSANAENTTAWLLDTANYRVHVCRLNTNANNAEPFCKSTALPNQ